MSIQEKMLSKRAKKKLKMMKQKEAEEQNSK